MNRLYCIAYCNSHFAKNLLPFRLIQTRLPLRVPSSPLRHLRRRLRQQLLLLPLRLPPGRPRRGLSRGIRHLQGGERLETGAPERVQAGEGVGGDGLRGSGGGGGRAAGAVLRAGGEEEVSYFAGKKKRCQSFNSN